MKIDLSVICGLDSCQSLTHLNLSSNSISVISGLDRLEALRRLDLSNNKIERIGDGLKDLHNLEYLNLRSNNISAFSDIQALSGLESLDSLIFQDEMGVSSNPLCKLEGYAKFVQKTIPSLTLLDGGHMLLLDCVFDMEERLGDMKPAEDLLPDAPPEHWVSVDADSEALAQAESEKAFTLVNDSIETCKNIIAVDCSHLLRKAQSVIHKSQTIA